VTGRKIRHYRIAGHDNTGAVLTDFDVLTADEIAADYGWTPPSRPPHLLDTDDTAALTGELVRLQAAVREAS
jgi:hypothetical protein